MLFFFHIVLQCLSWRERRGGARGWKRWEAAAPRRALYAFVSTHLPFLHSFLFNFEKQADNLLQNHGLRKTCDSRYFRCSEKRQHFLWLSHRVGGRVGHWHVKDTFCGLWSCLQHLRRYQYSSFSKYSIWDFFFQHRYLSRQGVGLWHKLWS